MVETLTLCSKTGTKTAGCALKSQKVCDAGRSGCGVPLRKTSLVSWWEATHWRRARALQTRFEAWGVSSGGFNSGYTLIISCNKVDITPVNTALVTATNPGELPNECHRIKARSSYCSLFLLNSRSAFSLPSGPLRS